MMLVKALSRGGGHFFFVSAVFGVPSRPFCPLPSSAADRHSSHDFWTPSIHPRGTQRGCRETLVIDNQDEFTLKQ